MKVLVARLNDILTEIDFLETLRARSDFASFRSSSGDVRAAAYSILIISEAVRAIPDDHFSNHPDIPWHAIRAIGNKLRHKYQRVSEVILWGIIDDQTAPLKAAIAEMISQGFRQDDL